MNFNVNPHNLIYSDLVGLRVRVAASTDPTHVGVTGTVVDETARTLVVSAGAREKIIPKISSSFAFCLPSEVMVDGSSIAFSPEERLKRLQRRRM
jgi:ribonuclease P protein subunit POP4